MGLARSAGPGYTTDAQAARVNGWFVSNLDRGGRRSIWPLLNQLSDGEVIAAGIARFWLRCPGREGQRRIATPGGCDVLARFAASAESPEEQRETVVGEGMSGIGRARGRESRLGLVQTAGFGERDAEGF